MLARLSLFALAVLALACGGGDGPTDPPVQQPRGAVVQLKSNNVLVFAGRPVSLRNLVWRVTDSAGRELTDYRLAAQLPVGWTIRNDTVIAPAHETVARLKVTATYQPTAASRYAGPLYAEEGEVPADTTDTATVTSAVDLKARKWRVSYFCANAEGQKGGYDDGRKVDSMRIANAMVDSVAYTADEGWIPQFSGVAQIWYSGDATRWLEDGDVVVDPFVHQVVVERQAPDTIVVRQSSIFAESHAMTRVAPGSLQQPLRYEGGTWCGQGWTLIRGPATLEEVAP